jgi:hypothetical protein
MEGMEAVASHLGHESPLEGKVRDEEIGLVPGTVLIRAVSSALTGTWDGW